MSIQQIIIIIICSPLRSMSFPHLDLGWIYSTKHVTLAEQALNTTRKSLIAITSLPLLHPCRCLRLKLLIAIYRAHSWGRLLVALLPDTCIAPSDTMRDSQKGGHFLVSTNLNFQDTPDQQLQRQNPIPGIGLFIVQSMASRMSIIPCVGKLQLNYFV